jgi:hypothetical protein
MARGSAEIQLWHITKKRNREQDRRADPAAVDDPSRNGAMCRGEHLLAGGVVKMSRDVLRGRALVSTTQGWQTEFSTNLRAATNRFVSLRDTGWLSIDETHAKSRRDAR